MSRKLVPATLAALGFAAAVATAPLATADEGTFLEELSINGVVPPGLMTYQVVSAGYTICTALTGGASILDEMDLAEQELGLAPGQGTLFVSAATTNLCPNFAG